MKQTYETESGDAVDEASDIAIRLRTLAGEIYNMETSLEWTKRQLFAATATGESLDRIARERGLARIQARKAKGTLKFSLAETKNYAVAIPAGTVVSTDGEVPVRVVTTEDGAIPQAQLSVFIPAEAEEGGFRGNITFAEASVPVNVPAVVSDVYNSVAFRGGRDAETDSELRERILESYLSAPNGMNAAYYKQLALSVEGVDKAGVVCGNGTATVYVSGMRSALPAEKLSEVAALIQENRCVGATISTAQASFVGVDLNVTVMPKTGFTDAEVRLRIENAFESYIYNIPIGGKFYLSKLGTCLMETDCIENYVFDQSMTNLTPAGRECLTADNVTIGVSR